MKVMRGIPYLTAKSKLRIATVIAVLVGLIAIVCFAINRSYCPMGGEVTVISKQANNNKYYITVEQGEPGNAGWGQFELECTPEQYQAVPAVVYPELYRTQTGETIQINKPVFRIGKERSYVDYFVTNNNAVSRSHADIISRETGYFIIDLNSKNRTYINNQAIVPQTETAIKDGDLLRLGNEEFVFRATGRTQAANGSRCCTNCNAPIKLGANFCIRCGQRV